MKKGLKSGRRRSTSHVRRIRNPWLVTFLSPADFCGSKRGGGEDKIVPVSSNLLPSPPPSREDSSSKNPLLSSL